jgi:hypothetical protein
MSAPDLRDHRALVHEILAHTQTLLEQGINDAGPSIADLLNTATEAVCDRHAAWVSPHHVAWLEAEAASHIITVAGWRPAGLTDPALPRQLVRLDQQSTEVRHHVLALAVQDTDPDRPTASSTTSFPRQRAVTFGKPGPCACACNSGGFCGGCGHAGCGARS